MENTPKILWRPDESTIRNSNLHHYMAWLAEKKGLEFADYDDLYSWSITSVDDFWASLWEYFGILSETPYSSVMGDAPMPETRWFAGSRINYAEHIFRKANKNFPAIIYASEEKPAREVSWEDLAQQVAAFRSFLISKGVTKGDRVAAFLPNIPEATIAFLATNSLGAIWTSTSPDFGISSVIDRFSQVDPKVLIAVNGYQYGGKVFDRSEHVRSLVDQIPSIESLVIIPAIQANSTLLPSHTQWHSTIENNGAPLTFQRVPFDHPMWVLYSSGTTGLPKPITHGHGGMLLEHLKYLTFHNDVHPGDRCFWYTTTGWMMWNYIQASLLCGATIVLYDGAPNYPDLNALWKFSEEVGITHFGTSAGFIVANMKSGTHPGQAFDLSALRSIGSTGSPLPPEGFDWCYEQIKSDLWLASISGGTDVCSAFVGGNPLIPVSSGEIQCRALGCALESWDEEGNRLNDEVGEMVITKPMPCMPIKFWNDPGMARYRESYFEMFPDIWRHGDWTRITPRGGVVIYGRSDSTLNRGGVRIGTSEIYRAVDKIAEIKDSIIICVDKEDGDFYMPLFVVPAEGISFDEVLTDKIKASIRKQCSPRHVPDHIFEIKEVPYTISGKKVETPIKKILMGADLADTIKKDALKNPEAINYFIKFRNRE